MKKLFKFLVGPAEITTWFSWKYGVELLTVIWGLRGVTVTICNLTIDFQKRDEEF
jgi:hypothetical protein